MEDRPSLRVTIKYYILLISDSTSRLRRVTGVQVLLHQISFQFIHFVKVGVGLSYHDILLRGDNSRHNCW